MSTNLVITLGYKRHDLLRSIKESIPNGNVIAINRPLEIYDTFDRNEDFDRIQILATVKPPSAYTLSSYDMKSWSDRVVLYSGISYSNVNVYDSLSTGEVIFRLEFIHTWIEDGYNKMTKLYDSIISNKGMI